MRRQFCSEFHPFHDGMRLALFLGGLGILNLPGSMSFAGLSAPVFQGTISSPTLCSPRGVALSPGGDLFVGSDCSAQMHMEQFDAAGALIASWPFPVIGIRGFFNGPPNGVALDGAGNVFVTDMGSDRIWQCTSSGALLAFWRVAGSMPVDISLDASGDVYVAEMNGKRVRKSTASGVELATFGSPGSGPGQFQSLTGIGLDASGRVYGTDNLRNRVVRFLPNGTFDMEFAVPLMAYDVAVGPEGNIYVLSSDSQSLYRYSPDGVLLDSFSSPLGLDLPFRIIIDPNGMIYVVEQNTNRITKFQIDLVTSATRLSFGRLKAMYR